MRFPLVVFDLDGTLVDSRRDLADSANALLEECGAAPHTEEAVGRMVGNGAATLVARAFAAASCPQPDDALKRFLDIYNRRLLDFTRPYDGIVELLTALSGPTTLSVLTNKPIGATLQILEALDLLRFFGPRVLGGDGPLPRKPNPAGLTRLVGLAGVSAQDALLVGDSAVDWRTAHAAGTRACMARYGFGYEGFPTGDLRADDLVIDRPSDLLTLLSTAG